MGSYQLIKETINPEALNLQGNKCTLRIEARERGDDVESALSKLDSSSSPSFCRNAASRCMASASGTTRLVSLDVFRGLTVVVTFHLIIAYIVLVHVYICFRSNNLCMFKQCMILIVAFRVEASIRIR